LAEAAARQREDIGNFCGDRLKLIEYVGAHTKKDSPEIRRQEETIYQLMKEDPGRSISSIMKATGLRRHIVSHRLTSLARQKRLKYVRMWVPMEEIDE
jgi:hypothetical protein